MVCIHTETSLDPPELDREIPSLISQVHMTYECIEFMSIHFNIVTNACYKAYWTH